MTEGGRVLSLLAALLLFLETPFLPSPSLSRASESKHTTSQHVCIAAIPICLGILTAYMLRNQTYLRYQSSEYLEISKNLTNKISIANTAIIYVSIL